MKTTLGLAASALVALSMATSGAIAQESKSTKDGIAGKAGTAQVTKAAKPAKPVAQPTAAAVKASPAPAMSKPAAAAAEGALGHGKDETKSHCHSRGSDA